MRIGLLASSAVGLRVGQGWIGLCLIAACGGSPDGLSPSPSADAGSQFDGATADVCAVDGDACDDGAPCTDNDTCSAGECSGTPKVCDEGGACQEAVCNPATGACETQPADDGIACDDGDLCTRDDACVAGACEPGEAVVCDGTETCVVGVCNPDTGACEGEPAENGTACENACVTRGTCTSGECRGRPVLCPSAGPCQTGLGCDPIAGCQYENLEDGLSCADGESCTINDVCRDGACVGQELICPEPPTCKVSVCDEDLGGCALANVADGTPCDDDNKCTFETVCDEGTCIALREVECLASPCMLSNVCNPENGRCVSTYKADGESCSDNNICTVGETCSERACQGGTKTPWTGVPCSEGICFTDVTTSAGITWTSGAVPIHDHAAVGAMADFDGDGWLDIVVGSENADLTLYINDQLGGFTDETATAGFAPSHANIFTLQGVAAGDYDGDGDLDLYVTANGDNILFQNDGQAVFTDVTAASGTQDTRWSTGAVFGDYDLDGDLDLYVGNYITPPSSFPFHNGAANSLFRNNGDGTFTDVAGSLNIGGAGTSTQGTTLVVAFTDFDQDGDADLMDCNDFGGTVVRNQLYENDGTGKFTNVSAATGADVDLFCMGIAVGDWNRDELLDYYHTSIGRHSLLSGTPTSTFRDVASGTGTRLEFDDCVPTDLQAGWATVLEDFDLDGWQDLFVANGYISAAASIRNPLDQQNKVLRNDGASGSFTDVSKSAGVATEHLGRGMAAGDYDKDGDIDVFVVNMKGAPELFRNDSPDQGRYLVLTLEGRLSPPHAPNALVTTRFSDFNALREYGVRPTYLSSSPTEIYIGAAEELYASEIEVRWPSGVESQLMGVGTNNRVTIKEPFVTIGQASLSGATAPGVQLTVTATLTNHLSLPTSVDLDVELWDDDNITHSTSASAHVVAGGSSKRVSVSVRAPDPLPVGGWKWVATVADGVGAVDQREVK